MEPLHDKAEMDNKGLIVVRAVVKADAEVLPVRVFNPTQQEKVIKKGTAVATVSSIQDDILEEKKTSDSTPPSAVPNHLQELMDKSVEGVPEEHHKEIGRLLCDFEDIFSTGPMDIGHTTLVEHGIDTGDSRPFRQAPRRYPCGSKGRD